MRMENIRHKNELILSNDVTTTKRVKTKNNIDEIISFVDQISICQ